jgi:uncharacterized protein (DUF4415 family)
MAHAKPNPYLIDEENPEWSAEDFKQARPAQVVLPEIFGKKMADEMLAKKPGRPLGSGTKAAQTVSFDIAILKAFKSTGKGWQTRMNDALRTYLEEHPLKQA